MMPQIFAIARGCATTLRTAALRRRSMLLGGLALLAPIALQAQIDILTNRYDPQRTGANLTETTLTAGNVTVDRFGKLYSYPVDGSVYAQPLYVSGVVVNGAARNVLYVATMNDRVYAFDADAASPVALWSRNFTNPPAVTPVPITDIVAPNLNIVGNVGVQGTPVIDKATRTLYLVARTKEGNSYVQRLHALDITTGAERPGSPVTIGGAVPGTAMDATPGPNGPEITFDPKVHVQRAGLALVNGVVLVAWASHEDVVPSHGWIMGFDASTLATVGRFAVTRDAYNGGIWQGGRAPTVDGSGHVYFATGNGRFDGTRNFGNSVLKFTVSRAAGLGLVDYFTPANEEQLSIMDDDLSGSGFTLLPGTNLLIGGGKEGVLYLLNAANLGRKVANDTQIVQKIAVGGGHVMGGTVFWNSPGAGPLVYNWSEYDVLKSYQLSNGRLATPPYAQGMVLSPGHPGGSLTLSANGSIANSGIIWASMPLGRDAKHGLTDGVLRAFDAETLARIWSSEQNPTRDRLGTLMKFVPPVVANGRVYLPNHNGAVAVYGHLVADFRVTATPASRVITPGASGTFSIAVAAQNGFAGPVSLTAAGQPPGTAVSFNPQTVSGAGVSTMTVTVPADAAEGSFQVTVTGTSGTRVRSAAPVTVTVQRASAAGRALGIDFVGSSTTSMAASETAGVVAKPRWNSATGASRATPLSLLDETGAATGATVTWTAASVYATPITDAAGNRRMMRGYLDTTSTSTTTITVAGLSTRTYDVYVYVDGANRSYARSAAYSISGPGITTATVSLTDAANTDYSSTFIRASNSAGNYVKFTITAGGFTLRATPTEPASGTRRAPVNGVQIIPVSSGAISVDFVGSSTTAMSASETAGVVARPRWNNAAGATRTTPLGLLDESGAGSGATITWAANGTWATAAVTDTAGNRRMMRGYLDTNSTSTTTVRVSGLSARTYDVYVYADGENHGFNRTAAYTISGSGITSRTINLTDAANTNFSSTFTQASDSSGNYVKFTITGTEFTLTARPVSGGNTTLRAPVNGIQIVPVP